MYLQNKGEVRNRFDYCEDDHSFDDVTFTAPQHYTMVQRSAVIVIWLNLIKVKYVEEV